MAFIVDCDHPLVDDYFPSIEHCAFKLSSYLTSLEKESEYIFKHMNAYNSNNNDSSQQQRHESNNHPDLSNSLDESDIPSLYSIMKQIVDSLNESYSCIVNIDESNTIYLKLSPTKKFKDIDMDHLVPIPIINDYDIKKSENQVLWDDFNNLYMDIGMKKLLPYINGESYVDKIISQSEMSPEIVKNAIKHLIYYDCVRLVDIFEFNNRYTVLPTIRNLYEDKDLQLSCIMSVTLNPKRKLPTISNIFKIYSQFRPHIDVKNIYKKNNLVELNIDIKKLINYGVLNNIIRLVRKYPLRLSSNESSITQTLQQYIDGKHSLDKIAVNLGVSKKELEKFFNKYMYI